MADEEVSAPEAADLPKESDTAVSAEPATGEDAVASAGGAPAPETAVEVEPAAEPAAEAEPATTTQPTAVAAAETEPAAEPAAETEPAADTDAACASVSC